MSAHPFEEHYTISEVCALGEWKAYGIFEGEPEGLVFRWEIGTLIDVCCVPYPILKGKRLIVGKEHPERAVPWAALNRTAEEIILAATTLNYGRD